MAVGDIYQVTPRQLLHGQAINNVFYYRETVLASVAPAVNLAIRFGTVVIPLMKAAQSNELSHVDIVVQKIWPLPPAMPVVNSTFAGLGSVVENSLPTSVAVTVTKTTAFAGRKYRGRLFMAGIPATFEIDSLVTVAGQAVYNALAAVMDDVLTQAGDSFQPILWHKGPKTFDDVLAAHCKIVLRNQRRRQVGKGI